VDEVATGDAPAQLAVTADSESAYVTNSGDPTMGGGSVSQYDVGAGGALSPMRPNSLSAGSNPTGIAVRLDGDSVYREREP
jgi:DNA-binding beta-propeller fold protein YncE